MSAGVLKLLAHPAVNSSKNFATVSLEDLRKDTQWLARASDKLKANSRTIDGKELVNGELVTVEKIQRNGSILLTDGRKLPSTYREFVRGYAVTSYASQRKTVEHVLFLDSAVKAATNSQQWLVSISRGTHGLLIVTQNKELLRENIVDRENRELAMELVKPSRRKRTRQRRLGATSSASFEIAAPRFIKRKKEQYADQISIRSRRRS